MWTADDKNFLRATLDEARANRAIEVELRRGTTTLPPQSVRFVRLGGQVNQAEGAAASEKHQRGLFLGAPGLEIQVEDRATIDGVLYRVSFVRPEREIQTTAELVVVE